MTYARTVVFSWARDTVATADTFGTAVKAVRNRKDMPHRFPNKRYMYEYLLRIGLKAEFLESGVPSGELMQRLWESYRNYNELASSSQTGATRGAIA